MCHHASLQHTMNTTQACKIIGVQFSNLADSVELQVMSRKQWLDPVADVSTLQLILMLGMRSFTKVVGLLHAYAYAKQCMVSNSACTHNSCSS